MELVKQYIIVRNEKVKESKQRERKNLHHHFHMHSQFYHIPIYDHEESIDKQKTINQIRERYESKIDIAHSGFLINVLLVIIINLLIFFDRIEGPYGFIPVIGLIISLYMKNKIETKMTNEITRVDDDMIKNL